MKESQVVAAVWSLHLLSLVSSESAVRWKRSSGGGFFRGGSSVSGPTNLSNLIADSLIAEATLKKIFPTLTSAEALTVAEELLIGSPEKMAIDQYSDQCERKVKDGDTATNYNSQNLGLVLLTEPQAVSNSIFMPQNLYKDHPYNDSHTVVIFVDDFLSNTNKTSDARDALLAAYKARGDVDFIVVDTFTYFEEPYLQAAFQTQNIGKDIAISLLDLIPIVPLEKIHLIGYGLGAQTVGRTAQLFTYYSELGKNLKRVTGLDPANPCFGEGEELEVLRRGYADFVDIIHTNSDVFGKKEATGDADFYPNGEVAIQPRCFTSSCSHQRAWEYYAESVYPGQENNFLATECESYRAFNEGLCTKYPPTPMGFAARKVASGKYFLTTKGRAPYGKSQA